MPRTPKLPFTITECDEDFITEEELNHFNGTALSRSKCRVDIYQPSQLELELRQRATDFEQACATHCLDYNVVKEYDPAIMFLAGHHEWSLKSTIGRIKQLYWLREQTDYLARIDNIYRDKTRHTAYRSKQEIHTLAEEQVMAEHRKSEKFTIV